MSELSTLGLLGSACCTPGPLCLSTWLCISMMPLLLGIAPSSSRTSFPMQGSLQCSALCPWKSTKSLYEAGSLYIPERPSLMLQGSAVLCAAELSRSFPLWGHTLKETQPSGHLLMSQRNRRGPPPTWRMGLLVGRHSQLWNLWTKSPTVLATGIFVWFCQLCVWVTLLPSAYTKPLCCFLLTCLEK